MDACPHHGLTVGEVVEKFYTGLNLLPRQHLDASAAGSFMSKTPTEAKNLIKLLVENQSWDSERSSRNLQPSKGVAKSVIERTHEDLVMDRLDAIQRRLDNNHHIPKEEPLKLAESRSTCSECGEFGHVYKECPEEMKMLEYIKNSGWKPQL